VHDLAGEVVEDDGVSVAPVSLVVRLEVGIVLAA